MVKIKKNKSLSTIRDNSPAGMIRAAVSGGADLEKLEKLLIIQERWEANEARKAYHVAMAAFKTTAPETILKNKKVSYATKTGGTVKYSHATLANVVKAITAKLSEHGLSVSWPMKQEPTTITITCKITHILGHSEEFSLTGPADDSGGKNAIQAIGSTTQYLQRYTLLAAIGLATEGQDDDGIATSKPEVKRPTAISEKDNQPKGLPDKVKTDFVKARKLLGDEDFLKILGEQSFEKIEQIPDIATANKILAIMGKAYKDKNE